MDLTEFSRRRGERRNREKQKSKEMYVEVQTHDLWMKEAIRKMAAAQAEALGELRLMARTMAATGIVMAEQANADWRSRMLPEDVLAVIAIFEGTSDKDAEGEDDEEKGDGGRKEARENEAGPSGTRRGD